MRRSGRPCWPSNGSPRGGPVTLGRITTPSTRASLTAPWRRRSRSCQATTTSWIDGKKATTGGSAFGNQHGLPANGFHDQRNFCEFLVWPPVTFYADFASARSKPDIVTEFVPDS